MKILALDTSSSACSVALLNDVDLLAQPIISKHSQVPQQQGKFILPLIQELLDESNLTLQDLDAIAFGQGPGSFTGLRIASSVVQGLAFAAGLPIICVSSLAVIAQTALKDFPQAQTIFVAIDARMEQIYWAIYQVVGASVKLIGEEHLCAADENIATRYAHLSLDHTQGENGYHSSGRFWQQFDPYTSIGVGDAWAIYQDILTKQLGFSPHQVHPQQLPHAEAVITLALAKYRSKAWTPITEALPNYCR